MSKVTWIEKLWLPKNGGLEGVVEQFKPYRVSRLLEAGRQIIVRAEDIPMLVEKFGGVGLTGSDLFLEYALRKREIGEAAKLEIVKILPWDKEKEYYKFGKPALTLMYIPIGVSRELRKPYGRALVNDKYRLLSRDMLLERVGISLDEFRAVLFVSGCSENIYEETRVLPGYSVDESIRISGNNISHISQTVIDIVSSGKTAWRAGLDGFVPLYLSDPILIRKSSRPYSLEKNIK